MQDEAASPDPIFSDPRLAAVYDLVDGERDDLDLYVGLVHELGATSVLDVGCGTGSLACRLARAGVAATAIDPAEASLQVARAKPGSDRVRWLRGGAADVPRGLADLAVMTGNVAQVFITDADWALALHAICDGLRPGGWFVFETRDPARRAWERWTPDHTRRTFDVSPVGPFTTWTELLEAHEPLVSFRHTFRFDDGAELTSDSTLRFRTQDELRSSLADAGFVVREVRDAPDRPGLEWVFVAQREDDQVASSPT